jgi:hypothetical protein
MLDRDPTNPDPEGQYPESSAAADNPEADDERQGGPPTEKLDEDAAYEPEGTGLKGLKGG